jgi:hypothetical protein
MNSETQPQAEVAEAQEQVEQETPPEAAEAPNEASAEVEAKPEESAAQNESAEVQVTIGASPAPEEEAEHEKAPDWLKQLRRQQRETAKENRELKAQLAKVQQAQPVDVTQPKPAPQLRDFEWDEDKHREAVAKWAEEEAVRKQAVKQREQQQAQAVNAIYADFTTKAAELSTKVKDFEPARELVADILDMHQQNALLRAADNSAVLTYALGKNPSKARALAEIKDPVKFIAALVKLEQEVKITPRKPASTPDQPVRGANGSPSTTNGEKELARLEAEAERTGDRSKVIAYKRRLRKE